MAWLHATPKPDARSKRAQVDQQSSGKIGVSRLDHIKKDGIIPSMPPNPAPHIIDRLVEIGLTEANGMSVSPLSWRELNEWQRATGIELAPWEARLIRRLSVDYIAEGRRAESENCPPPWHAEVSQRELETEEARLRMVLG